MKSLWDSTASAGTQAGEFTDGGSVVRLTELKVGSTLPVELDAFRGLSVLMATDGQLATALAMLELDGVVRRMVLCTPDLTDDQLAEIAKVVEADALVVSDSVQARFSTSPRRYVTKAQPIPGKVDRRVTEQTEWIIPTSGTSGVPKLVVHTLQSLAGALPKPQAAIGQRAVWSTFYDIRRYGGLQIYLRAVLGGAALVLSRSQEPIQDFLARAGAAGVSHISGTPSHWRRALMSGAAQLMNPSYVRLSGEIADQPVLDALRTSYPDAQIAHAFASTEAGVAFVVEDGLAGFPAALVEGQSGGVCPVRLRVADGTLRVGSQGIGKRYLGAESTTLMDGDGYVDTGDLVELIGGRYHFRGRRGGVINVGGLKVYPEEVEAVLNADARVRMSLVRGRRNPITGAVVVADVVLSRSEAIADDPAFAESLKADLLSACRQTLPAHKVPAVLRFISTLELTAAGKLVRPNA